MREQRTSENKNDTPAQMPEPIHLRQIITKDTQDNWVVSLITWTRPVMCNPLWADSRKPHSLNMSLRRIKFPAFRRFLQLKRAMYHLVTNRLASHAESICSRISPVPGDLRGIEIGDLTHARNGTAQRDGLRFVGC